MTTLQITRGSDWSALIRLKNADGSAINATGYTVTSTIQHSTGQITVVIETVDAATGVYRARLDEAATALVPIGAVSTWRLTTVTPGGDTTRVALAMIEGLA